MGRKSRYALEQKIQLVKDYLDGCYTITHIEKEFNIPNTTLYKWIYMYETYGIEGLIHKPRNQPYTKAFKEMVVQKYLDGKGSLLDLTKKYNIPSKNTLHQWVLRYNSHIENTDYCPQGEVYMAADRRTTTWEERITIVKYCLSHDKQYKLAASEYNVSYRQVYSWVQKYLKSGEDGLLDKRGKAKLESELTDSEKLQHENKR